MGAAHTTRVLEIALKNFEVPSEFRDLVIASIVLPDIGGPNVKEQYEKGPEIAATVLRRMGCDERFIERVCHIVGTHHDHPDQASIAFRILYDSDKLVMFSPEEFPGYDSRLGFDWNKIIDLLYSKRAKSLAKELLRQRSQERSAIR